MSAAAELKRDLLDLQGQYDKLVPLHQGQSRALQVLLKQVLCETCRSNCTTRLHIFEHERLSREPEGKGRELLQILISRELRKPSNPPARKL